MGAARKIFQTEKSLGDYIPYSHHVSPTVISTVKSEYLSVWKIQGRAHQSASQEDVFIWLEELNNLLRGIGGPNIGVWSHIVRRRVEEVPERNFSNYFAQGFHSRYAALFKGAKTLVNELYLTVIDRPFGDGVTSFMAGFEKASDQERADMMQRRLKSLDDINRAIGSGLHRYGAKLLRTYDRGGYTYSEPLEFLASLVNGEAQPMPVLRSRFREYMVTNRVLFDPHGEIAEVRRIKDTRYFGMLEIADYAEATEPGHLNCLLEADCELVVSQSFALLSKAAGKGKLDRQKRMLRDSGDVGQSQIEEIDDALDLLVSGVFLLGEHHGQVLIWGDSPAEVRESMAKVNADLLDRAILPKVADTALESGFLSQLPGNWAHRPRMAPITSLNFLSFSSLHNFMRGKATGNPWGHAVCPLKTTSGAPFYFNFHYSPPNEDSTGKRLLGNTMIIGPSSGGKTVLMGLLLTYLQALDAKAAVIDKDRGMEVTVRALGGTYLPLKVGERSGFNPFQLEATPANKLFLKRFVSTLVGGGGTPVTHADEVQIERAVETVMTSIDKQDRRLSTLIESLPDPEVEEAAHPTVASRLLKWCELGELGWLFDNADDGLDMSGKLYGFDVTEFLPNEEIRAPIMMYLLHRIESMIDGSRFVLMLDEFWKLLDDSYFVDLVRNKLKTIRKENGIVVFATQQPDDMLSNDLAQTIVQQCATQVILANPRAKESDYRKGLHLTEAEYDHVKTLGETSRRFLVKQGEASAICELNLSGFDDDLLVLSGTPDRAEIAEQLIAKHGAEPGAWLPHYLKTVGTGA